MTNRYYHELEKLGIEDTMENVHLTMSRLEALEKSNFLPSVVYERYAILYACCSFRCFGLLSYYALFIF